MTESRRTIPSTARLVAFSAAYKHGNFTRAADDLQLTQAAISRQVRELEEELGVSLFTRRARDVVPTQAGHNLADGIDPALASLAESVARVKVLSTDDRSLTVFSDHSLAGAYLLPLIAQFERQHNNITVQLISSNSDIETIAEPFDLAVYYGTQTPKGFEASALEEDLVYPIAAPGLVGDTRFSDIEKLTEFPLFELDIGGREYIGWKEFLHQQGCDKTVVPKARFDSYTAALDAVISGQGLLLGWHLVVRSYIDHGLLRRLGTWSTPEGDGIHLYSRKSAGKTSAASVFRDWVLNKKRL